MQFQETKAWIFMKIFMLFHFMKKEPAIIIKVGQYLFFTNMDLVKKIKILFYFISKD